MGATCESNTSSTVVDIFVQYEMLSRQTCYMFQSFSFSHLSILLLWVILDRKTKMGICWSDKIFCSRKNEFFWKKMRFFEIWWFYESTLFWCTIVSFYRILTLIPSKFQVFFKLLEFVQNSNFLSFLVEIWQNFKKQIFLWSW